MGTLVRSRPGAPRRARDGWGGARHARALALAVSFATGLATAAAAGGYGDGWILQDDPRDRPLALDESPLLQAPPPDAPPPCRPERAREADGRRGGGETRLGRLRRPLEGAVQWGLCQVQGLSFAF